MADISKAGAPALYTYLPPSSAQLNGLGAGEDIAAGDACYVKSDGLVWRSIGTAANAAAKVRGYASIDAPTGTVVNLFFGVVFIYGSGLTPGANYYLSGATAGALADTPSTGGTSPIAWAVTTNTISLNRSTY